MKATAFVSIAIAMSVLAGPAATADPIARNHPINKSQQDPKDAAPQGAKSGEQSEDEVRAIAGTQGDIEKLEREYKADGILTSAERTDLEKRTADARRDASE